MDFTLWQWAGLFATCGFTSFASVFWYLGADRSRRATRASVTQCNPCVALFNEQDLFSATPSAALLIESQSDGSDWLRLRCALTSRFPDFPSDPCAINAKGVTVLEPENSGDPCQLRFERIAETLRVELAPRENAQPDSERSFLHHVMATELRVLRDIANNAPDPIWTLDEQNRVGWHNSAYAQIYQSARSKKPHPDQPLFSREIADFQSGKTTRSSIRQEDSEQPSWFDLTFLEQKGTRIVYAANADSVVQAEAAQRNFVQTLAKTFAQLSIGLAIFDRNMQLILFNPALTDLTDLPIDFLSGRPNLFTFFDRLRDQQVMPEPRDYSAWRDKMGSMIAATNNGEYSETWTLPSGSTYRISGRPNPDGAVAFLIEDITAEMSLTRRFRSDLELSYRILDELNDAIAVFSASGTLTLTNDAYRDLWKQDDISGLADITIFDAMSRWTEIGGPNTLWGELRDFVLGRENRVAWTCDATFLDGRIFDFSVLPVQNGATLIRMSRRAIELSHQTPVPEVEFQS